MRNQIRTNNFKEHRVNVLLMIASTLLLKLATAAGELEPTFGRCCVYGANWARNSQECSSFPFITAAIPTEHQSVCITSAAICCLRYFRDEQCQKGKEAAQMGQDCVSSSTQGAEYFKDCCHGCKLGLFSSSMGAGCSARFKFGFPWDYAYLQCCSQASSSNTSPDSKGNEEEDNGNLYPALGFPPDDIPDSENLCLQLPGKLCSDLCVPTPGSYRCMCRPGFTLSVDGKTCIQDSLTDRCQVNNPCDHVCRDTGISVVCSCNRGFTLKADQKSCEDINECTSGVHGCVAVEQVCYNLVGSYVCINADGSFSAPGPTPPQGGSTGSLPSDFRPPGFEISNEITQGRSQFISSTGTLGAQGFPGANRELALPTHSQSHGRCPPGYSFNLERQACDDVDECEVSSGLCGQGAVCHNTIGSYTCSHVAAADCPTGFAFDLSLQSCLDIDECEDGTNNCNWTTHFCVNTQGGYMCQEKDGSTDCLAGYKFSTQLNKCIDIDECAEELDICNREAQTCVNSKGSYRCIDHQPTCDFGYIYSEEQKSCVDIDECVEGRDFCNKLTEECVNSEGSYWCRSVVSLNSGITTTSTTTTTATTLKPPPLPPLPPKPLPIPDCPVGTEYNSLLQTCADIDECLADPCEPLEECINTQGSFYCDCQLGYHREEPDGVCEDLNECQLGSHSCTRNQRCDNTIGSFACVRIAGCGTGYTLNHNTGLCDDNDECKLGTHNCAQLGPKYECINIKGSFRCNVKTCPPLHVLRDDGECVARTCDEGFKPGEYTCVDVNECIEDNPCRRNERCINILGSYRCQPLLICNIGYEMNEVGTRCIDIDECARGTHQCEGNQSCSNREGTYVCMCPRGFRLNAERHCEDINECASFYGRACASNAVCENTEGSFRCNCKEGFKQASNSVSCIDVDECLEVPDICHHNCINVWGSYQCTCRAGHILNSDNRTCEDVDECESFQGRGHLCIGLCVNVPGSFKCACPDGYNLAADGRTCKDVNECETGSVCHGIDEQCVNTRGGYKCHTISCPQNYVRDQRHKNRCKKLSTYCPLDDEECLNKPLSYSYNYLPLISNITLSSLRKVDLFTMRGPMWASTTVQFELELEDVEVPVTVTPVTRDYFQLRRTAFNQAVISLVRSIIGPQEIQLSLNMKLYQQGRFSGSAVAKLLVYVSEYPF